MGRRKNNNRKKETSQDTSHNTEPKHVRTCNYDEELFDTFGHFDKGSSDSVPCHGGARPKVPFFEPNKSTSYQRPHQQNAEMMERNIYGKVKRYEEETDKFNKTYKKWRSERLITIQKLRELSDEVHKDQLNFNKTNLLFKELNVASRCLVTPSGNFLASFATLFTDAVEGITSVAQAFNVDQYMSRFQEIMDHDTEITKPLYVARSLCIQEYHGVEEIVCRFHSDTFGTTVEKISSTLNLQKLWLDIKDAQGNDQVSKVMSSIDQFFSTNANAEVLERICTSVQSYVDGNPAAMEACKSAGKTLYGICNTFGQDVKKKTTNSLAGQMSVAVNNVLLREQQREVTQLRHIIENEEMESQAKIESKIKDAIDALESELNEIGNIFNKNRSCEG